MIQVDHVFLFVASDGPERQRFADAGLTETYRRRHRGQGTANACYAFENLFLELLWVEDEGELASAPIRRTRLLERSRWALGGACPFGIAWRGAATGLQAGVPTWRFCPPYLPSGVAIEVAEASDDPAQPMLFCFPGSTAPATWGPERQNGLQSAPDLTTAHLRRLTLPRTVAPSPALAGLAAAADVALGEGDAYEMELLLHSGSGTPALRLRWPACDFAPQPGTEASS